MADKLGERVWSAGGLLALSGSYWEVCALHAAVKLGVFSAIGWDSLSAAEVAKKLKCSMRGAVPLLDALVAMGLISKDAGVYTNSSAALAYLVKDSHEYVGHMLLHHHYLMGSWSRLDEAVVGGRPVLKKAAERGEAELESFLMGMFTQANLTAPHIVPGVDLSGRRWLLDLGGGPGTYAIRFCLANEHLRAVVYDLPTTRRFAEETAAKFDVGDRIRFHPGDYLNDEIPGKYDAAWLSHILHGEGPEDCRKLVAKAASALEPGGVMLIHEFILDDDGRGPLFPALFSLNMLIGTEGGRSYTQSELFEMLAGAGLTGVSRLPVSGQNGSGVVAGYKPK